MTERAERYPWLEALAGAVVMAGACTLGDFLWVWIPKPHPWWMGVLHGVGMFALVGMFLGATSGVPRRPVRGALAAIGLSAVLSASFYLLYGMIGVRVAMALLWFLLWVLLGLIRSWLAGDRAWPGLRRGAASAVLCGTAFYLLVVPGWSGHESGLNVWIQLARWTAVFLAAFVPLLVGSRHDPDRATSSNIRRR